MTWKGAWLASGDDGAAGEGNFKSENQFLWLRSGNPTKDRKTTVSLLAFFSLFSPSRTSEGSQHPFAVVRAKPPVSEWVSERSISCGAGAGLTDWPSFSKLSRKYLTDSPWDEDRRKGETVLSSHQSGTTSQTSRGCAISKRLRCISVNSAT